MCIRDRFGVALWGERNASRLVRIWPVVYTLSLAVHCTAWTYYGAVAQACLLYTSRCV